MFSKFLSLLTVLGFAGIALADHTITMVNKCSHSITPFVKNTAQGVTFQGNPGGAGTTWTTTVPENWSSGRIFGATGSSCNGPDGAGCTLVECDFSNPSYYQCNLSSVSGFSDPTSFSWPCGTTTCSSANDPACYTPSGCVNDCIKQCNQQGEGITVTWCP